MMAGATESRRSLIVHTTLIIIFASQFATLHIIYYSDRACHALIFQISSLNFSSFISCNLLLYSLFGYLLTRIESRGLLQYSYHITKSRWTKAIRAIYQICWFQGTNAWKTARVSAANAPNKLCVLPK